MNTLKNLFFIFLCMISFQITAQDVYVKIYVPEELIELTYDGVCIRVGNDLYQTDNLYEDEEGFFIQQLARKIQDCPRCKRFSLINGKCIYCGYPDENYGYLFITDDNYTQ
jgi:hypothetical protein